MTARNSAVIEAEPYDFPADAYAAAIEPPEDLSPSEFAEKHRVLHEVYCSERPGRWSNDVFPYQRHVMNAGAEAIRTGKRGVCLLKAGQGGGTDAMITLQCWLKVHLPGPQLFMTSTDYAAEEFGRERFWPIVHDMEPLRAKLLGGREAVSVLRFSDGKIQLCGGQSVFRLQSTPYRVVVLDELDSIDDNLAGAGDPLRLAEVRTDSFTGQTLILAYAHPTTKDRGIGKLYFESSDQRRGFVTHACGAEFWLQWEHVKFTDPTDPRTASYCCPACGAAISDGERVGMIQRMFYRSVLPPEVAARRRWIGLAMSQLYYPAKTILSIAERWVECQEDENQKQVFQQKVLGEPIEHKVQDVKIESLRSLVVVSRRQNDPEYYGRGEVPKWVRFLTAGHDSKKTQLHYAIWGWGLRRSIDGNVHECGALIDWGIIPRKFLPTFEAAEFHVLDAPIYNKIYGSNTSDRTWMVKMCGHDIGYDPTQIPLATYVRSWPGRAVMTKGAALTATSACNAPPVRPGNPLRFKGPDGEWVVDEGSKPLLVNTYMLKCQWFGWANPASQIEVKDMTPAGQVGTMKVNRLLFPHDVDAEFLRQSANEELVKGERKGELVWHRKGPNHYADCNIGALACFHELGPFMKGQTAEEAETRRTVVRRPAVEYAGSGSGVDPAMG